MLADIQITALNRDGFALVPDTLALGQVRALRAAFAETVGKDAADPAPGTRNVLRDVPPAAQVAASPTIRQFVKPFLGDGCFAVRGILFDKTPGANWKVVWHQDLSLAVTEKRAEIDGWGPWSVKAGVTHVQPPVSVLERMLTVRLHLDPCDAANGPLRVLPGTHRLGRLGSGDIARLRAEIPETVCTCPEGGALLMRPLLLHASSPATDARRRRVLHIEFAAEELPGGLDWYERIDGGAAGD